ncbi:MAG: TRAP transporter large permease subunit [Oscillospiraceae bacterium]|nr:TRAP transporter large permease subunit [Oscillospiraceae bacterium]
MEPVTIGIIFFLVMIGLILIGVPVFLSMMVSCFAGFCMIGGLNMAITQFTTAPLNVGASYTYAVLPLFMLVGTMAGVTGIAEGAFSSLEKWLGRVRGGLLYTLVVSNAVFGACSGISTAGSITFARLALPEMDKAGYDRKLSLGTICGAGILSTLIPPSIGIILICVIMNNMSIGTALNYGLSAGILLIAIMCVGVFVYVRIRPDKIPDSSQMPRVPMKEKLISLKHLLPIVCVFLLIIGGTMLGWFAATVAGAVASVALVVYALIKHIPLKTVLHCVWDAVMVNAGFFPIIVAGNMFSRFVSTTQMVAGVANFISSLALPACVVFLLVVVFYLFCGCVMDIMSIVVITVPIVLPLLVGLGYNEYIVCVLLVFMCDMAGLTPPIGMNVFAVANALRVRPMEIFSGVTPFFLMDLAAVLVIGACPAIITWLPALTGAL